MINGLRKLCLRRENSTCTQTGYSVQDGWCLGWVMSSENDKSLPPTSRSFCQENQSPKYYMLTCFNLISLQLQWYIGPVRGRRQCDGPRKDGTVRWWLPHDKIRETSVGECHQETLWSMVAPWRSLCLFR